MWRKMESIAMLWVMGVCFVMAAKAQENNPYIRQSVGTAVGVAAEEKCLKDGMVFRPITCWAGEKFIFMQKIKNLREHGYMDFLKDKDKVTSYPSYKEAVGRIGTISEVQKVSVGWEVQIRMDDNGQTYYGHASKENSNDAHIGGIVPILDLQAAKAKWLGKDLWLRWDVLENYDEEKGEKAFIKVPMFSHVKVLDVVASTEDSQPVRFIVKTDTGKEGYVDVQTSGTNYPQEYHKFYSLEENLLDRNPRKVHPSWSASIWQAITSRKIIIGMTAEQVEFCWGKPESINTTRIPGQYSEQWVYSDERYVYFKNGNVSGIQR